MQIKKRNIPHKKWIIKIIWLSQHFQKLIWQRQTSLQFQFFFMRNALNKLSVVAKAAYNSVHTNTAMHTNTAVHTNTAEQGDTENTASAIKIKIMVPVLTAPTHCSNGDFCHSN